MVKQIFEVGVYWKVVVYYNLNPTFFDDVKHELKLIGFPETDIDEVKETMFSGKAKAVTCSSSHYHTSIVLFNSHNSRADYISSIVHEAEHIKQAMLKVYNIEDVGEAPAYTIGYLVKKMWRVFSEILSNL